MPAGMMDFIKFGDFQVLGFRYTENTGAAFSSFSGAGYFLIIFNIVVMAALIFFIRQMKFKSKTAYIAVMLVISGGLGNIIDRIRFGYVIDFLEFKFINFAIFNFADICIVSGAFLLLIYTLWIEIMEKKANKSNG